MWREGRGDGTGGEGGTRERERRGLMNKGERKLERTRGRRDVERKRGRERDGYWLLSAFIIIIK